MMVAFEWSPLAGEKLLQSAFCVDPSPALFSVAVMHGATLGFTDGDTMACGDLDSICAGGGVQASIEGE